MVFLTRPWIQILGWRGGVHNRHGAGQADREDGRPLLSAKLEEVAAFGDRFPFKGFVRP